ncbi:MAG: hypothetical protein QOD06_1609 [Candidatus Binatota bacterium]|jgi:hypothetical protein|nr:hypothetical protein [Candidatus Binatota bacterium]
MGKRLAEATVRRLPIGSRNGAICVICGGAIIEQESHLPTATYPHRRVCRTCGAEYHTTMPQTVKY